MTIKFNEKIKKFIVYKKSKPSIRLKNNPKKQVIENTIKTSTRILLMY